MAINWLGAVFAWVRVGRAWDLEWRGIPDTDLGAGGKDWSKNGPLNAADFIVRRFQRGMHEATRICSEPI